MKKKMKKKQESWNTNCDIMPTLANYSITTQNKTHQEDNNKKFLLNVLNKKIIVALEISILATFDRLHSTSLGIFGQNIKNQIL